MAVPAESLQALGFELVVEVFSGADFGAGHGGGGGCGSGGGDRGGDDGGGLVKLEVEFVRHGDLVRM